MNITGKSKLLGLLGNNIGYSVSPLIHNYSSRAIGEDYAYVPFDLKGEHVERFLDLFWHLGGVGFNVTTPHKERVAELTKGHKLRSVNTVYRGEEGWEAISTDTDGLMAAVRRLGVSFEGFKRVIILGSGGVVAAILSHIARQFEASPEIIVLRRNPSRDEALREALPEKFDLGLMDFDPMIFQHLIEGGSGETVVIQATSAPHQGDDLTRFATGIPRFNGVLIDLVYGARSALLDAAVRRGIPCQNGLPMLVEQARLAQQKWWGKAAPYQDIFEMLCKKR